MNRFKQKWDSVLDLNKSGIVCWIKASWPTVNLKSFILSMNYEKLWDVTVLQVYEL